MGPNNHKSHQKWKSELMDQREEMMKEARERWKMRGTLDCPCFLWRQGKVAISWGMRVTSRSWQLFSVDNQQGNRDFSPITLRKWLPTTWKNWRMDSSPQLPERGGSIHFSRVSLFYHSRIQAWLSNFKVFVKMLPLPKNNIIPYHNFMSH